MEHDRLSRIIQDIRYLGGIEVFLEAIKQPCPVPELDDLAVTLAWAAATRGCELWKINRARQIHDSPSYVSLEIEGRSEPLHFYRATSTSILSNLVGAALEIGRVNWPYGYLGELAGHYVYAKRSSGRWTFYPSRPMKLPNYLLGVGYAS